MFCTKCGKELINPGKFCVACGAPLTAQPAQAPVNPNTVLYDGNCMWTTGGVFYSNCYMTVTYEKIMLFKNKRAKERGEQPMVTIFCNTIRAIRMTGNMQGPYMILTMTDGKSLNFRYLFAMQEIHNACQRAARFHNPQWFQY